MGAKRYGVPYQGSKNGIAAKIVDALPGGEVFVDLFAGGCAVTHAAMESGKYGRFVVNDADWRGVTLFRDAVMGKYRNERRLVDREYFLANKDRDAYVSLCWSFGCNGKDYLWNEVAEGAKLRACRLVLSESREERLEAYRSLMTYWQEKKEELEERKAAAAQRAEEIGDMKEHLRAALCEALRESGRTQAEVNKHLGTQMAGHYFGRSQWAFPTREEYGKLRGILTTLPEYEAWGQDLQDLQDLQSLESLERLERLESLQNLQSLQSLESLERLERLQSLESLERSGVLERLSVSVGDYRAVAIPEGAVVYCDPPYKGTNGYFGGGFDHEGFYEWLRGVDCPVWVSEYGMPGDFFPVWGASKNVTYSSTKVGKAEERLWLHERWRGRAYVYDLFNQ